MKNKKILALIQFFAGCMMLASGAFNLGLFGPNSFAGFGFSQILAILQIIGGLAFLYLSFKKMKAIG